jgi:hypothetical protein
MHRARWLFASAAMVAASLLQAAPAAADTRALAIDLVYDVRVGGMRAFSTESQVRLDGNRYLVEANFRKEGIVAALSQTFNGRNRVSGQLNGGRVTPQSGYSLIETRSTRTWNVTYRGDGSFGEQHTPAQDVKPERVVTPAQKHGAVDPLTAGVLGVLQGGEPCGRTYQVFDSRRRFNVEMRKIGPAKLAPNEVPQATGQAFVCAGYTRKIAGYAADNRDDDNRNPPRITLSQLNGAPGWWPVKLEMRTSFGELVGRLSSVTIRPLTDGERSAMRQ